MRMLDSSPDFSHLKAAIEKASVKGLRHIYLFFESWQA